MKEIDIKKLILGWQRNKDFENRSRKVSMKSTVERMKTSEILKNILWNFYKNFLQCDV